MDALTCIVLATLAGGLLSVGAAFAATRLVAERWIPRMVSFAVGVMLATALLDLIPEAAAGGLDTAGACSVVLWGLLLFFMLEKLALWRHEHAVLSSGAAIKPAGVMMLIGDGVHKQFCRRGAHRRGVSAGFFPRRGHHRGSGGA